MKLLGAKLFKDTIRSVDNIRGVVLGINDHRLCLLMLCTSSILMGVP